jgi:hypothetical protein
MSTEPQPKQPGATTPGIQISLDTHNAQPDNVTLPADGSNLISAATWLQRVDITSGSRLTNPT